MLFRRKKSPPKVCVLGNSHITAFKRHWDSDPSTQCWQPTFFGTNSISLKGLQPKGTQLHPPSIRSREALARTSGGQEFVECEDFDEFYLHGMLSGAKLARIVYDVEAAEEKSMPLSSAFTSELINNFIEDSLLAGVVSKVRQATSKPIFASSGPLPSIEFQRAREGFKTNGDRLSMYAAILDRVENALADFLHESNTTYLRFPKAAIVKGLYSDHDYMVGSQALDGGTAKDHPRHDLIHANDKYGKLLFDGYMQARK